MGGSRFSSRTRIVRAAIAAALTASLLTVLPGPVSSAGSVSGFTDELVAGDLVAPTVAAFAPGGRLFIGEKSGLIKTYASIGEPDAIAADLRDEVYDFWDRGLLGLAVHPEYPAKPYVYALYSLNLGPDGKPVQLEDDCADPTGAGCVITARLSKLTIDPTTGVSTTRQPLITDWCQQFPSHTIGTVTFGPDGALYVGGGDGANFNQVDYGQDGIPKNPCGDPPVAVGALQTPPSALGGALRSQSPRRTDTQPRTLDGTIARVDPETGAGMPDNPYATSADANARRIIAYGMRNQYRFGFRPGTKELWVGDVGWNSYEEINRIPDATDNIAENFGWPCYEGSGRQGSYDNLNLTACETLYTEGTHKPPYYAYHHSAKVVAGETCASGSSSISGIAFEDGTSHYPLEYRGALFFSDYSRQCIWAMRLGDNGQPDPNRITTFASGVAGPVQLLIGPGGDLFYIAVNTGELRRITYSSGNRAPVARATADPTSGQAPLTVRFDASGSTDADAGDVLSYAWDLDADGQYDDSTEVSPQHTYIEQAVVRVGLRVTDHGGLSSTTTLEILVDDPPDPDPIVVIDDPTADLTWEVGQSIPFSGRAADPEDGPLGAGSLSWRLTLQHCSTATECHAHVMRTIEGVSSGSLVAPDHSYPSYLDLTLTARDSDGNTSDTTLRLHPRTVRLDFESEPSGLDVSVGGDTSTTPFSRTVIVGSGNSITAPNPQDPDYWFTSWSDGGPRSHTVFAPSANATYRASYLTCTVEGAKVADCGGPLPSSARSFTAQGGRGKAAVSWRAPHWPGVGGLTKYQLAVSGGKVFDLGPSITSYAVGGLGSNKSYSFTLTPHSAAGPGPSRSVTLTGTSVASSVGPSTIVYGSSTTVKGTFRHTDTGAPLVGAQIELLGRPKGGTGWSTHATTSTDGSGVAKFVRRTGLNWEYQLAYGGDASTMGTTSAVRSVTVRHAVAAAFDRSAVVRGGQATLSGQVGPNHGGQAVGLQRYADGRWITVGSRTLSSASTYAFAVSRPVPGTYSYRVVRYDHGDHATGYSAVRTLVVR